MIHGRPPHGNNFPTGSEQAEQLARLLDATSNGPGQWVARCVCHEDNKPSMSIGASESGKLLLHCFAGCDQVALLGAVRSLLSGHNGSTPKAAASSAKLVASYLYKTADNQPAYKVERYESVDSAGNREKTFRQSRFENGKFISGTKNVAKVPYRLPELLRSSGPVFICEGEKNCDRLASLDVVASTNSGGCGNSRQWQDESFRSHFTGRDCVILADNDAPGRKHSQAVAAALHGVAASVRVVDLPGLSEHGDVSDWLDGGADVGDIYTLAQDCEEWQPPVPAASTSTTTPTPTTSTYSPGDRVRCGDRGNIGEVVDDQGGPTVQVHFTAKDGNQATRDISRDEIRSLDGSPTGTPRPVSFGGIDCSELSQWVDQEADWLVDGIFTIDEMALFPARSKGCKTLQLTDLAVAVTSGTQWMGCFEVPKRRKVLFITGEANYRRIAKHISAACRARGLDFGDLSGWLRIEAMEFPHLPDPTDHATIRQDIETHGIEVVIVDPIYRGLAGVDASRLSEMGSALKGFQKACEPACVILSHHVIKSAAREYGEPPSLEDMSGAGLAESCGQWWLVGRNEKYEWDHKHDLCVSYGGREGQAGGKRILFNEQKWTFDVMPWHDYIEESQTESHNKKATAREETLARKVATARAAILRTVMNIKTPQSQNQIYELSGSIQKDFRLAFSEMAIEETLVVRPYKDTRNRLQANGYIHRDYIAEYDQNEMLVDARSCSLNEEQRASPG